MADSSSSTFITHMKRFDAYPKVLEDFRVKTFSGATVTALCAIIMGALFLSELSFYLHTEIEPELLVDTTRPEKLRINVDVFFPQIGCSYLSIEAMDVSGEQHSNIEQGLFKKRYDLQGKAIEDDARKEEIAVKGDASSTHNATAAAAAANNETGLSTCGSCYGAETKEKPCCETCDDVKDAYREKGWTVDDPGFVKQCKHEAMLTETKERLKDEADEGCQIYGFLEVSKVAGKFHIKPKKSGFGGGFGPQMLFQFVNIGSDGRISMNLDNLFGSSKKFNVSHHIRNLSFGEFIPGVKNPLDGTNVSAIDEHEMHQYFVKIVPTVYRKLSGEETWTNQYSVTKQMRKVDGMPSSTHGAGLFVRYELSPLLVQYTEKRRSLTQFLTGVCAIIGGVFTVAGLIDSMIYRSSKVLKQQIDVTK